jgi:Zn-dependent metalloprotease
MKTILIPLIITALLSVFCFPLNAQTGEKVVKRAYLASDSSVRGAIPLNKHVVMSKRHSRSDNFNSFLKQELKLPANYEVVKYDKANTELKADKLSSKSEIRTEHYVQLYKGFKVEKSDLVARYRNDELISVRGSYIDADNINTDLNISKEDAIVIAAKHLGVVESVADSKTAAFSRNNVFEPELLISINRLDTLDSVCYLTYKVRIDAEKPFCSNYVYVTANSGKVIGVRSALQNLTANADTRYSGTKQIGTRYVSGTGYQLVDETRGIWTHNLNHSTTCSVNTPLFTNANGVWNAATYHNANKDDGVLDAHWGAAMTYDYFKNRFNMDSYDGMHGAIHNYVHYGTNYVNASWDGQYFIYGDGDNTVDIYTCLDVVAHEFGHAICEKTINLEYEGDSGAINESFSDIWGACVENYVNNTYCLSKNIWLHREELGAANRSLSNPNLYSQPDTYGGAYWISPNDPYDEGGIHTNSGVMNYWFYLLCNGGSGVNDLGQSYNVPAAGISDSEYAVFLLDTDKSLSSLATFADVRDATIEILYELPCPTIVKSAQNAWHAVGVGSKFTNWDFINITYSSDGWIDACLDLYFKNIVITNNATLDIGAFTTDITIEGDFTVYLGSDLIIH